MTKLRGLWLYFGMPVVGGLFSLGMSMGVTFLLREFFGLASAACKFIVAFFVVWGVVYCGALGWSTARAEARAKSDAGAVGSSR